MKKKIIYLLSFSPYGLFEIYRNIKRNNKRIKNQKLIINDYLKNNEIKKLQIGCGSNFLQGWLNTDLRDCDNIAFLDAGGKFPIESDTFDYIYSEHLFEHLTVEQQHNMLAESYRILKKGGVMRLATPSLDFLFKLYANPMALENKQYVNWAIENIPKLKIINNSIIDHEEYYCYVINNFFKAWGHQMIHNYSSLKKIAIQNRFSKVRLCNVGQSEVQCLQNIEKHGTIIPENINLMETMVVEIIN
jgi:predicted SAM-dependent methyltransferase